MKPYRKTYSKTFKKNLSDRFNSRCAYCGCKIEGSDISIDHFIPITKSDDKEGKLLPSCFSCNSLKSDMEIEVFRKYLETRFFKGHLGKALMSYYGVKPKKIIFYYEKLNGEEVCQEE